MALRRRSAYPEPVTRGRPSPERVARRPAGPRGLVTVLAVLAPIAVVLGSGTVGAGCLPGAGPALLGDQDGGGPSSIGLDDGGLTRSDVDLGDPYALEGLTPSHGPFTGGTRATLTGRGFSSRLRVFLGAAEVPPGSVLASDPTRAAIVTPPGPPGFVDVRIRDDATAKERVLAKAFYYDAFVVQPDSGATSGGTRITLTGSGTAWTAAGTTVAIGGVPCQGVTVAGPTALECTTAAGAPGAKDVTVTTPDGKTLQARDAFTYSDSTDGYRGGLSGGALSGRLRVLAYDAFTGTPIAGAPVVAGSSLATGIVQPTAASGVTEFNGLTGGKVTVTVTAECHQPITYVDVPVDTVTAYLAPVLDPACAHGDPPSTGGGGGRFGGVISGDLVFRGGNNEFQRVGWTNVPDPTRPTERRAAYVFEASSSPNELFALPPPNEAITPESAGASGYGFTAVVFPGNATLYVVAGLEDRSETPPRFVPYVMGIARGISVPAQTHVTGVDVAMDILFDHQVTMAPLPPAPGPRGPDRFLGKVALTLGSGLYAILPRASQVTTLPAPATLPFLGLPSLDHAAASEQYVLGGVAATGADLQRPASVVGRIRTTNANDPVAVGGFLGVPVLGTPGLGAWDGTHVSFTGASGPVDLSVVQVSSGNGLVSWNIVAPGGAQSFEVPDLDALATTSRLGLVHGPITTTVYAARIDGFAYGKLRQGQLGPSAWNAHAFDALSGAY
ncbi:MAG: hypothetical protein JWP97_2270 [Labilithrix sp.]|nr:hypothetical protein [Labilithrix sp.]